MNNPPIPQPLHSLVCVCVCESVEVINNVDSGYVAFYGMCIILI